MLDVKGVVTFTAAEAVRQARSDLRQIFAGEPVKAMLRKDRTRSVILIKYDGNRIDYGVLREKLKAYLGYIDVAEGIRFPLWHAKDGWHYHYEVDAIRYKDKIWRDVTVTQEESKPMLRYWRLSAEEFERNLKPYLNRWSPLNQEALYSVIVESKLQSEAARERGLSAQAVHNLIKSAYKIYVEANSGPHKQPISEKRVAE